MEKIDEEHKRLEKERIKWEDSAEIIQSFNNSIKELEKERKEIAKEITRKERTQGIISNIEVRFGEEVDDNIKNCLASIQDEDVLKYH